MSNRSSGISRAIIAGGGIGGLTAALCLLKQGVDVDICERSSKLTETGAGIQLSPNACAVFAALGVLPAIRKRAFEPERIEFRIGATGKRVFSIPLRDVAEQRWGQPYLHVHRADLLAVLLDAFNACAGSNAGAAASVLHLGCAVERFAEAQGCVTVDLSGGERLDADVLIGADGIHSRVHEQLFGSSSARFTGNIAWRTVVPVDKLGAHAPPPTACIWAGRGRHAVTYRLRGGELANFVGVVETPRWAEESWTQTGTLEQVLADFSGFDPVIQNLIVHADQHFKWALLDRPPLAHWHAGRVVLLGDACHPMLPFVAQGAAQAIEDAWVLAEALSRCGSGTDSIAHALSAYVQSRHQRTSRVQAEAIANQRRFHHAAPAYWPLWAAAKVRPGLFHTRQDWLYGHDVTAGNPALR